MVPRKDEIKAHAAARPNIAAPRFEASVSANPERNKTRTEVAKPAKSGTANTRKSDSAQEECATALLL